MATWYSFTQFAGASDCDVAGAPRKAAHSFKSGAAHQSALAPPCDPACQPMVYNVTAPPIPQLRRSLQPRDRWPSAASPVRFPRQGLAQSPEAFLALLSRRKSKGQPAYGALGGRRRGSSLRSNITSFRLSSRAGYLEVGSPLLGSARVC